MSIHCSESWGTVEETIESATSSNARPRSASRFDSAAPSSSPVDCRTVANRQCSATRSPSDAKTPKCVCVLPTSTTRSMVRQTLDERWSGAPYFLTLEPVERVGQALAARHPQLGIEFEQRHQDEPS